MRRHILVGFLAGALLIAVFLGILSIAQGWGHAVEEAASLWYWILALAAGFGVQAGLFSFIRQALKERRAAATASISASGGVSAGSMVACCAHHLADVLPFLGASGLAAFFAANQSLFLFIGVLSNLVGITVMLETVQRHGLCPIVSKWRLNMGIVKKGTMASAGLIASILLFKTILVG